MLAFLLALMLPQMNVSPVENFRFERGQVYVVEAYFNTCPYCNYNAPNVDSLAESYKSDLRVHVLDVGIDKQDSDYQSWIRKHNPNHPVLKDSKRQLVGRLGTTSYPSTYVIDCLGNVAYKTVGEWSGATQNKIKDAIEKSLQLKCD